MSIEVKSNLAISRARLWAPPPPSLTRVITRLSLGCGLPQSSRAAGPGTRYCRARGRAQSRTRCRPLLPGREQILALAMARHTRLGAASKAKCLNADALSHVHKCVCEAHQELAATKRISKICVRTGNVVDRVEIHFSDGAFIGSGGGGGEWRLPVTLEIGEYIIGFGGRKGGVLGDSLGAIYFTTNLGRAHNFAGRFNGGRAFHKLIEPGHELISFSASSPPGRTWLTSTIGYNTVSSSWTSPMASKAAPRPSQPRHLRARHHPTVFPPRGLARGRARPRRPRLHLGGSQGARARAAELRRLHLQLSSAAL